jgi:hypothetical protein
MLERYIRQVGVSYMKAVNFQDMREDQAVKHFDAKFPQHS